MKYVKAYVNNCNENNLTVICEDGMEGYVPMQEVTNRPLKPGGSYDWMVGREYVYAVTGMKEDGTYLLSGKQYEEYRMACIVNDFNEKRRNVYNGRFVGIASSGKAVFYQIDQGINVMINLANFSYNRIISFKNIHMPTYLPVVIKEVNEYGLLASAKPAFGDFRQNIDKMNVKPGTALTGYINGMLPNTGHLTVVISPNLMTLLERGSATVGAKVGIVCTKVLYDYNKIRCEFLKDFGQADGETDIQYENWIIPFEQLPEYIDLDEFHDRVKSAARGNATENYRAEMAERVMENMELTWPTNVATSPFATYANEMVVYERPQVQPLSNMKFEMRMGYLDQNCVDVAVAISELHYTTTFQVQRYLHLKKREYLSEHQLHNIIQRLRKYDIIGALHFSSDGKEYRSRILFPGLQFQAFTGARSNFYPHEYNEMNARRIKCYLAANQLLIGTLYSNENIISHEHRVYLSVCEKEKKVSLKPRHKVVTSEGTQYLEAVRQGNVDDMLEKLQRYQHYFNEMGEHANVLVTLETEDEVNTFADRLKDKHFTYDVGLVTDLRAIPKPDIQWIKGIKPAVASKKIGFLQSLFMF